MVKTFKLKLLEIVDSENEVYDPIQIPLTDGLIINREDDNNSWLIEAYTDYDLLNYFKEKYKKKQELIVHVKITKDLNDKATCLTTVIGLNEIGDKINVLLLGTMVNQRTIQLEKILEELVSKGNKGKDLLEKFKQAI